MASSDRAIEPASRLRPATPADMRPAFAVFRRSLVAYIHRIGLVESPDTTQAAIEEAWAQRGPWIEHLWRTAAENWVAEDAEHGVFGWAMSVERGGMLELTHFFVDPAVQSKGVGRALLERAFPPDRGRHRSILATHDPRALGLYLRSVFGTSRRFSTSVPGPRQRPSPATSRSNGWRPRRPRSMRSPASRRCSSATDAQLPALCA